VRKPVKTAAVLFGLGVGAAVGPALAPVGVWPGIAVASLGIALSLVGTTESDLIPGDEADPGATGGPATARQRRQDRERPTLTGLSTRVEQILRLAEEQAADHRAEARREAEEIVAAARLEAKGILDRAAGTS